MRNARFLYAVYSGTDIPHPHRRKEKKKGKGREKEKEKEKMKMEKKKNIHRGRRSAFYFNVSDASWYFATYASPETCHDGLKYAPLPSGTCWCHVCVFRPYHQHADLSTGSLLIALRYSHTHTHTALSCNPQSLHKAGWDGCAGIYRVFYESVIL